MGPLTRALDLVQDSNSPRGRSVVYEGGEIALVVSALTRELESIDPTLADDLKNRLVWVDREGRRELSVDREHDPEFLAKVRQAFKTVPNAKLAELSNVDARWSCSAVLDEVLDSVQKSAYAELDARAYNAFATGQFDAFATSLGDVGTMGYNADWFRYKAESKDEDLRRERAEAQQVSRIQLMALELEPVKTPHLGWGLRPK